MKDTLTILLALIIIVASYIVQYRKEWYMSQEDMILQHLLSGSMLTPLEALHKFGCFRLGARCYDLRKKGHDIRSQMIEIESGKRVAQYYLAK